MRTAVRIPAIRAAVLIVSLPHFAFLFPFVTRARDLPLDVAIPEKQFNESKFFRAHNTRVALERLLQ